MLCTTVIDTSNTIRTQTGAAERKASGLDTKSCNSSYAVVVQVDDGCVVRSAGLGAGADGLLAPSPCLVVVYTVLFCSLAVLDPRIGYTMYVLSPFVPVLCHSD